MEELFCPHDLQSCAFSDVIVALRFETGPAHRIWMLEVLELVLAFLWQDLASAWRQHYWYNSGVYLQHIENLSWARKQGCKSTPAVLVSCIHIHWIDLQNTGILICTSLIVKVLSHHTFTNLISAEHIMEILGWEHISYPQEIRNWPDLYSDINPCICMVAWLDWEFIAGCYAQFTLQVCLKPIDPIVIRQSWHD